MARLHAAHKEWRAWRLARYGAPSRKAVEALYRRFREASAEQRAYAAEVLTREAAARCRANTARLVGGQVVCPFCGKRFPAQSTALDDSFGDPPGVSSGVNSVLNRQRGNCCGVCEPAGCGDTFHLPERFSAREACGLLQDGVCPCGRREAK